jgi:hypothetical protein
MLSMIWVTCRLEWVRALPEQGRSAVTGSISIEGECMFIWT